PTGAAAPPAYPLSLHDALPLSPAFADAEAPTPAELRRRALWGNWRGIADLAPGGGYGDVYGSLAEVPGREFHAYATVPGAKHPQDRKSTRLNSSHVKISYAVFC